MVTKVVTIIIQASTDQAASATARRVVNTLNNVADWANTNQTGLVTDIQARTQDVTVASTVVEYQDAGGGTLVLKP